MGWSVDRRLAWGAVSVFAPLVVASPGCAKHDGSGPGRAQSGGASASAGSSSGPMLQTGGNTSTPSSRRIVVSAEPKALTVTLGQAPDSIALKATEAGVPVNAAWTVNRGDIGSISPTIGSSVALTPTGKTGGSVRVSASFEDGAGEATVVVRLQGTQNGARAQDPVQKKQVANAISELTVGGGIAGVGGEGLGPAIVDQAVLAALTAPQGNASPEKLALLYPYDGTVWPRGMLAPLLMWDFSLGDADAIRIGLSTSSGTFSWTGSFGRPAILQALRAAQTSVPAGSQLLGRFVRHPIPQDVWEMATNTATAHDRLDVELTVVKDGKAYGPVSQSWIVAEGRLTGTVYYNSYGTSLVANSGADAPKKGGGEFGAAVLAIRSGETEPRLIAGLPSTNSSGCRGCHLVSANGSRMITQTGGALSAPTVMFDLAGAGQEMPLEPRWDWTFAWAALSPDGTLAFTTPLKFGVSNGQPPPPAFSQLYAFPPTATSTPIPWQGMSSAVGAATPAFSPDGRHLAFDLLSGTVGSITGTGHELVVVDFDRNSTTFSNARLLARTNGPERAGFPSFLPSGDAAVFHHHLGPETSVPFLSPNRVQQQARLDWSDLATGTAEPLFALNGMRADVSDSYLPTNDAHPDDTILNFEPNVNPVATGGYFWVIFTSRRRYGNLADGDPWRSDPGSYDSSDYAQITTKKLWVAAIDINGFTDQKLASGSAKRSDPSHPAFYLPAQELIAGNSRGFWVLDACRSNGERCASGDQCCDGYCRPSGSAGVLVCNPAPPTASCAQSQEACQADANCCESASLCINGFCAFVAPEIPR